MFTECYTVLNVYLYARTRLLTYPEKPRNARNTEYQLKKEAVLTSSNRLDNNWN
jgi:hypothetical protein